MYGDIPRTHVVFITQVKYLRQAAGRMLKKSAATYSIKLLSVSLVAVYDAQVCYCADIADVSLRTCAHSMPGCAAYLFGIGILFNERRN
jgi:hypothetical protein